MQIALRKSLTSKLFILTSLLIVFSVGGISYRNAVDLKKILTTQIEDELSFQAESSAREVDSTLSGYFSQATVLVPQLMLDNSRLLQQQLENYLEQNEGIAAVSIYGMSKDFSEFSVKFTRKSDRFGIDEANFSTFQKEFIKRNKKWTEALSTQNFNNIYLTSIENAYKKPLVNLVYKFLVKNSKSENLELYYVLTIWKSVFENSLPNSFGQQSFIVDLNGKLFATPNNSQLQSDLNKLSIVKLSLNSSASQGLVSGYYNSRGEQFIGTYAIPSKYQQLRIIVQKDTAIAFSSVKLSIVKSALYGALFLLIALLFSSITASRITKSLRELVSATQRVSEGDFAVAVNIDSQDEVGFLGASINEMAKKIGSLLNIELENARKAHELETAKIVQSTLFPKNINLTDHLKVSGYYCPATECGGDLWGYFEIKKNVFALFIADAMGHGVPAALITALAYSSYKTIEDLMFSKKGQLDTPDEILKALNRVIFGALEGGIHMTCFLAVIDLNTNKMTYSNAGHNFPLHLTKVPQENGEHIQDETKLKMENEYKISPIKHKGTPLGLYKDSSYTSKELSLNLGDRVVFYTDGIVEGESPDSIQYGKKLFYKSLVENANKSAIDLNESVVQSAFSHFKNNPLKDDITLVVVEVNVEVAQNELAENFPSLDLDFNLKVGDFDADETIIEKKFSDRAS